MSNQQSQTPETPSTKPESQENIVAETKQETTDLKKDIFTEVSELLSKKIISEYKGDFSQISILVEQNWTPGTLGLVWNSLTQSEETKGINEQVESFNFLKNMFGDLGSIFDSAEIDKTSIEERLKQKILEFLKSEIWQSNTRKREKTIDILKQKMKSVQILTENTNSELNLLLNAIRTNNVNGLEQILQSLKGETEDVKQNQNTTTPPNNTTPSSANSGQDAGQTTPIVIADTKTEKNKESPKTDKEKEVEFILDSLETKGNLTKIDKFVDSKGNKIFEHIVGSRKDTQNGNSGETTPYLHKDIVKDFIGLSYDFYHKTTETLKVVSSFRTSAHQTYLKRTKGKRAANKNRSRHNAGIAIDIYEGSRYSKKLGPTRKKALEEFRSIAENNNFLPIRLENRHFEHKKRDEIGLANIEQTAIGINENFTKNWA